MTDAECTNVPIDQLKPSDIGRLVTATRGANAHMITVVGHLEGYSIVIGGYGDESSVMIAGKAWTGCFLSWTPSWTPDGIF